MSDDKPNATATALVMLGHGAFLAACGVYGAASADWAPKAMHSAYAGLGCGGTLALCAGMAVMPSRKMYMIGVHVALLLQVRRNVGLLSCRVPELCLHSLTTCCSAMRAPSADDLLIGYLCSSQVLFTGVFGVQAYRSYGVPEKADRFPLFVLMGVGSVGALCAMRAFKPKKPKKP